MIFAFRFGLLGKSMAEARAPGFFGGGAVIPDSLMKEDHMRAEKRMLDPNRRWKRGMLASLRKERGTVLLSLAAVALLLFPTFSTADDFHVCRHSLASLASFTPSKAHWDASSSDSGSHSGQFCVACVWSFFDSASPAEPHSLDPAVATFPGNGHSEPSAPTLQTGISLSERAPPAA